MSASQGGWVHATTADGVRLAMRWFAARGARRGVCLCTHAMMASGRYLRSGTDHGFAGHLARGGLDVYVLDWRGHGDSRMPRGRADWNFDDYVIHDAPAAVRAVCEHAGIEPRELAYIGHSLGGLVGLAALATDTLAPVRALGLFATSVWTPGTRGPLVRRALMRLFAVTTRVVGHAPVRALRLGSEDEPRGYVEQLTGWARDGVWQSRAGLDYLASLGRVRTPVLAATGDGDWLCRPEDSELLLCRLASAEPLIRVGRAAGFAEDANHFSLLTSRALSPLWDRVLAFFDRTPAP